MPKKILVVDDDPAIVKYLTAFLKDSGYETCTASNGEEALQILREEKADLVTLDLQMPNETGTRFYRNLSKDKHFKDIPVVIISGLAGRHLAVTKPVAVFDKPVDRNALLKVIQETIG